MMCERARRFGRWAAGMALGSVLVSVLGLLGTARAQDENEPGVHESDRLGIRYKLVPYGKTFGARLVEDASMGPAAEIQLEKGDMIISLDNQAITRAEDLENHFSRTPIVFINIRTSRPQRAELNLPPLTVKPTLAQPDLRRVAEQQLRSGAVDYRPTRFEIRGDTVWHDLGVAKIYLPGNPALSHQFGVEVIRLSRAQPAQRQFWEPYLQRVEALIAEEVAYQNSTSEPDSEKLDAFNDRIEAIYKEATDANAAAVGKVSKPLPPLVEGGIYQAVFQTPNNQGTVLVMESTRYLIRQLDRAKRPISDAEFASYNPGQTTAMSGDYMVKVLYPNGASGPLRKVRVDHSGRYPLN